MADDLSVASPRKAGNARKIVVVVVVLVVAATGVAYSMFLGSDWRTDGEISAAGFGPLKIGMSQADAEAELGEVRSVPAAGAEEMTCLLAPESDGLGVLVSGGKVIRVDIWTSFEETSPGSWESVHTDRVTDAGVLLDGSKAADVYKAHTEVSEADAEPPYQFLIVGEGDGALNYVVSTEDQDDNEINNDLMEIRAGEPGAVESSARCRPEE